MSFKSLKQISVGIQAVSESLRSDNPVDKLFIKKGQRNTATEQLIDLAKKHRVPFFFVPPEKLDRMTNVAHQGVVAVHGLIRYQELDDIIPFAFEQGDIPLIVVCDRITDVRNIGAIARSAECLGAHALLVPAGGSAQINDEAIKSSAGALGRIPVCRTQDMKSSLKSLQMSGLHIICATEKESIPVHDADLRGPLAIVMGSEGGGVDDYILELSDARLGIPMSGSIGSLNVSVAAGMMLYEVSRQRGLK